MAVKFGGLGARTGQSNIVPLLLGVLILGLALLISYALSRTSNLMVIGALGGAMLLIASFMSPQFGVAVLIMSMLLSPEVGGGGGGNSGRAVVIRLDDLLLVILSAAWFARTAVHKDLGLIRKSPLNKAIGLYTLSCVLSTTLGFLTGDVRGKLGAFFVLRYIEYFIVFFVAVNFINSRQIIRRFMNIAYFTSILIAIYGVSQIPSGIRVSAPFEGETGEPNTLGGYLLLLMCMAGGQLCVTKETKKKFMWAGYILFLAIPLLFTGSRASWLGIPAAMAAFFFFTPRKKEILLMTVLLLVAAPALLPESVKDRILFTFRQKKQIRAKQLTVGGVRLDTSTTARLASYEVAVEGWSRRPILGFGVTGFIFIDSQYFRTLAELGTVGLLAFFYLCWGYYKTGRAAMRAAPDRYQLGISIGYLAALFGLLTHAIGSNTFIILRIMEPWMLFTAIIIRIPELQKERDLMWEQREAEEAEAREEIPEDAVVPAGAAAEGGAAGRPAPEGGEKAPSEERFEKKLTEFEQFLEREKIEEARLEKEAEMARARGPNLPLRGRPGPRAPVGRPPARTGAGAAAAPPPRPVPPAGPLPPAGPVPPAGPRHAPVRAIDLARGKRSPGGGNGPRRT